MRVLYGAVPRTARNEGAASGAPTPRIPSEAILRQFQMPVSPITLLSRGTRDSTPRNDKMRQSLSYLFESTFVSVIVFMVIPNFPNFRWLRHFFRS